MGKVINDALEMVGVNSLKPHPLNPRQGDVGAILESIDVNGFYGAIVAQKSSGRILAGNHRYKAAVESGLPEVPVIWVDVDDDRATRILLADNRTNDLASYDESALASILSQLANESDLQGTGYDGDDLDALIAGLAKGNTAEGPDAHLDQAAELQAKWQTETGQLWVIGGHRLLCGDSTSEEDVNRLLNDVKPDACVTDPPYGVGYEYNTTDDTPENLSRLIGAFLPMARKRCSVVLLTPGNSNQYLYPKPEWTLSWFVAAGTGRNPWGFSCWQPILAYGKCPYLAHSKGSRPDAVAITESSPEVAHPCPKPEGVWRWVVDRASVSAGDVIYDPFCGSGTTMVACEQLSRICYAMEIDPGYCAVILERMSKMGLEPKLVNE